MDTRERLLKILMRAEGDGLDIPPAGFDREARGTPPLLAAAVPQRRPCQ